MSISTGLTLLGLALFIVAVLIWVYRKRHLLMHNARFTGESVFESYQAHGGRQAVEEVRYLKEEKQEDETGNKP